MGNAVQVPSHIRFGDFEADLRSAELRRNGSRLRLPDQSFQVLAMLLQRPGELVTREEIQKQLWPQDTFVDFDHGLNNAVNRLREALKDSAEAPKFIETVPRRGYRFIGQLIGKASSTEAGTSIPGRDRRPRILIVVALVAVTAVLAFTLARQRIFSPAERVNSLAVLPLENLSHDVGQEYFSDGITDALITELGKIDGPRVISHRSVMQFKANPKPFDEIARELNVDAIVEGSVEQVGERVRLNVRLLRVSPERQLWSEEYERSLRDVFALQAEIARSVAGEIKGRLAPELKPSQPKPSVRDAEAYSDYLRALYLEYKAWTVPEYQEAIALCQRSIQGDPTFAPAYAELAISYFWLAHPEFDGPPVRQVLPQARAAAAKSIELDPSSVRGHLALALLAAADYNWTEADAQYRTTLRLDPNCAECHHQYGALFQALNHNDDATAQIRQAIELDPLNDALRNQLAFIGVTSHQYDLAVSRFTELHNAAWPIALAWAYNWKGEYAKAIQVLGNCENNNAPIACSSSLAAIDGYSGDGKSAKRLLDQLLSISKQRYVFPTQIAYVYLGLGEKDQALTWLERAYDEQDPALFWLQAFPCYDSLRSEPRFQALLRKVNFSS